MAAALVPRLLASAAGRNESSSRRRREELTLVAKALVFAWMPIQACETYVKTPGVPSLMLAMKVALMTVTSVGWTMPKAKASTAPKLDCAALAVAFSGYSFAHQSVRAVAMADLQAPTISD